MDEELKDSILALSGVLTTFTDKPPASSDYEFDFDVRTDTLDVLICHFGQALSSHSILFQDNIDVAMKLLEIDPNLSTVRQ